MTTMPWCQGKFLLWDYTCPDTLAPSYINRAVTHAGAVANEAEALKMAKYSWLSQQNHFVPIAIETLDAIGDEGMELLKDIGRRIAQSTQEPRATAYLFQRLSVAVQQGNAACVLGTGLQGHCPEDIFYI